MSGSWNSGDCEPANTGLRKSLKTWMVLGSGNCSGHATIDGEHAEDDDRDQHRVARLLDGEAARGLRLALEDREVETEGIEPGEHVDADADA